MTLEPIKNILKNLHENLLKKYSVSTQEYSKSRITSLMFHKRSRYTTIFIEYLISDDIQEFLSNYYTKDSLLAYLYYLINNNNTKYPLTPMIINEFGRKLILDNKRKKALISEYYSKMNQISRYKQSSNNTKFSYILPIDVNNITGKKCEDVISEETIQNDIDASQEDTQKNNCNRCTVNESESTINNLNVNDDISFSIDLTLNKNYDEKLLKKNIAFVEGKNNKNDEELVKLINKLKPLDTNFIYDSKKKQKNFNFRSYMNSCKNKKENKNLENGLKCINKYCDKVRVKTSRNNSSNKNSNTNSFNINTTSNINLAEIKKKIIRYQNNRKKNFLKIKAV